MDGCHNIYLNRKSSSQWFPQKSIDNLSSHPESKSKLRLGFLHLPNQCWGCWGLLHFLLRTRDRTRDSGCCRRAGRALHHETQSCLVVQGLLQLKASGLGNKSVQVLGIRGFPWVIWCSKTDGKIEGPTITGISCGSWRGATYLVLISIIWMKLGGDLRLKANQTRTCWLTTTMCLTILKGR